MAVKKKAEIQTAAESTVTAENAVNIEQTVNLHKEKKTLKTANTGATEGAENNLQETFMYIGPTTKTGLVENTVFTGSREDVEQYLKDTVELIPQVRMLLVATKNLAGSRAKVKKAGTILNKYYNDVLCLSKAKED